MKEDLRRRYTNRMTSIAAITAIMTPATTKRAFEDEDRDDADGLEAGCVMASDWPL